MTCFWHTCNACLGRGELHPNSPHAQNPAQMSGEVRELKTSVCRKCKGCGIRWKGTIGQVS